MPGEPAFAEGPAAPPPFAVPRGGRATVAPDRIREDALLVVLYRADGSRYASGELNGAGDYDTLTWFNRDGEPRLKISAVRPNPRKPVTPRSRAGVRHRSNAFCGVGVYAENPPPNRIYTGYTALYINGATVPGGQAGINSVLYGWDNYNSFQNWCGLGKSHSLLIAYAGNTSATPGAGDNVNTVGFGPTTGYCPSGSVACTLVWMIYPPYASEIDIRFNGNASWMNNTAFNGDAFDIEGVSTHEAGHAAGLGHVGTKAEVMYTYATKGDLSNRALGRGDAIRINDLY